MEEYQGSDDPRTGIVVASWDIALAQVINHCLILYILEDTILVRRVLYCGCDINSLALLLSRITLPTSLSDVVMLLCPGM
jgi:hypothetical protein